jgi:small multidrug resistance pump
MDKTTQAVCITLLFSAIGIAGDYFLKISSEKSNPLTSIWFYVGFCLYASTAFGWVIVMRTLKLSTMGVIYSVAMILMLALIGATQFGEKLNAYEVLGILMAIGSLILLMRFA